MFQGGVVDLADNECQCLRELLWILLIMSVNVSGSCSGCC